MRNLSIVITTYCRPVLLGETLQRLLVAAPADSEIVVADDDPHRSAEALVTSLADARLRYHANQERLGAVGNANDAIARARGDWIHWCADDDYVLPGFYEAVAAGYGQIRITHYQNVDRAGKVVFQPAPIRTTAGLLDRVGWVGRLCLCNPTHMVATVFRRETFWRLGGFSPVLPKWHDWWFLLAASVRLGIAPWYDPRPLARYREHPASLSGADRQVSQTEAKLFALHLRRLLDSTHVVSGTFACEPSPPPSAA